MYTFMGQIGNLFMRFCQIFPLKDKIVFSCFDGKSFGCNPKAIFDEMVNRNEPYEYVWLLNKGCEVKNAKVAYRKSFAALYHLATAKVWIDNSRKREWVYKRKGQFYIQTWHAGFAMKKVEKDAMDKLPDDYLRCAKHDSEMADLFISASKWNTQNYRDAFWYPGRVLECGLPRSDVFFKDPADACKRVNTHFQLADHVKIAVYCPTFRDSGDVDCYYIDYQRLLDVLRKTWGGDWKVIVRLHPNVQSAQSQIEYSESILNGTKYPDVNDLIVRSDLLITDYSSCMFDAILIDKKVIIYANDVEAYTSERGLYFQCSDLPFPYAETNDQLMECVEQFAEQQYLDSITKFKNDYGFFDNGTACDCVINEIRKVTQKS